MTAVGRDPVLATDGGRVVVGYTSASDPEVRVSRDRGVSFPRTWGCGLDSGDSSFVSLALEGRSIVDTVAFAHLDYGPFFHRLTHAIYTLAKAGWEWFNNSRVNSWYPRINAIERNLGGASLDELIAQRQFLTSLDEQLARPSGSVSEGVLHADAVVVGGIVEIFGQHH